MKTELVTVSRNEPQFPLLATLQTERGLVVMFTALRRGIVLKDNRMPRSYPVGSVHRDFIPVTNDSAWRILSSEEKVILTN